MTQKKIFFQKYKIKNGKFTATNEMKRYIRNPAKWPSLPLNHTCIESAEPTTVNQNKCIICLKRVSSEYFHVR